MPTPSRVLISGIGVAGPMLAYWLVHHGFEVTLVEEASQPRTGGYVIDFWGLGFDVAEKMGLIPALKRQGYMLEEVRIVDANGRRVGGFAAQVFARATNGRYVSIARSDLAREIYGRVSNRAETIFGDRVTGLFPESEGVRVHFEHAKPREFSLVIGADGLHSGIRALAFPRQDGEVYLGYKVAAFQATGYPRRDELTYVSYSQPGKQIARFSMRDDRTLFLFVFVDNNRVKPHDLAGQRAVLRDRFGNAGWECRDILDRLNHTDDLYFDRVSQIRLKTWSRGRIALVGDAAFSPSLLAGEGAGLGMAAAYVLAGEIAAAKGDYKAAFARYQMVLSGFLLEKQDAARRFASAFAPRTEFGLIFRNLVTRAMRIPVVADLAFGQGVRDRIALPAYP